MCEAVDKEAASSLVSWVWREVFEGGAGVEMGVKWCLAVNWGESLILRFFLFYVRK